MAICKKCGAHIEEDLKYCDKCGSEIALQEEVAPKIEEAEVQTENQVENKVEDKENEAHLTFTEQIENAVHSYLPEIFTKKGDRISLMIGLGSLAALALVYIACFFSFMPEICLPVGLSLSGMDGASPLWVVAYFVFGLFPTFFVVKAFLAKNFRFYAIFVSAGIFLLTLFTLVFWGMCEPANFNEAASMYINSPGSIAWFSFVDCLSEAWYLKLILSLASVFGFGVDYIVNKGN